MAQDLERIVDLLKEIKRANSSNTDSFDRLLSSISTKLDLLGSNTASTELVKAYLGELAKTVDEKYSTTLAKYNDIEHALQSLYNSQKKNVKVENMQELFDVFSKNLNGFYSEAKQQKAVLSGIESKLADLGANKSDKEDILRTISLLRNDFENLNHAYKSTIDNINSDLKSILSNIIKLDQTQTTLEIKDQIQIMYKATSDIVSYLKSIDEKESVLEKLLANVATNESLKYTQKVIDSIIERSEEISQNITKLADKSDVKGLQDAAAIMNEKIDKSVSKKEFAKISTKTEDLVNQTDDIKQTLAKVTQDIESLPNTKLLEDSLQNLFVKVDSLADDIENSTVGGDIFDINTKITTLKDELSTIKNIVTDLNEVVTSRVIKAINDISFETESYDIKEHISKILSELPQKEDIVKILEDSAYNNKVVNDLVAKTDIIADRLDTLPTHKDMDALNSNQLSLVENLQEIVTKEDVEQLASKSDDIEKMIDNLNFDDEFENLYKKTSSIENWLVQSKIKENADETASQIAEKASQKDLLKLIKTTKEITDKLENLSQNSDFKKVNTTVSDVYSMIEELKNDFINTTEVNNDSVIVQLSELQNSISGNVTSEEFTNFIDNLKDFTKNIEQATSDTSYNVEDIHKLTEEIAKKIDNIDVLNVQKIINENFEELNGNIKNSIKEGTKSLTQKVSSIESRVIDLAEFMNNNIGIEKDTEIQRAIADIKEVLENKKSNIAEIDNSKKQNSSVIQGYLDEIKNILDTSDKGLSEEVQTKFAEIEDTLSNYISSNENKFTEIIEKLDNCNLTVMSTDSKESVSSAIPEISAIKTQIEELGKSFASLRTKDGSADNKISLFVSEKLDDISNNIANLTDNIDNGLQQGFTYNAELIEEKTSVLLDFIKELRHASTDNIELFERLTVTDNKLMDFKQELELINTDVISNLNSKADTVINELLPIKEMLENLSGKLPQVVTETKIKKDIRELHDKVNSEVEEGTKYSQSTYDRLENTYELIEKSLETTENNLRDFILSDIDSVIIKVDNLREELNSAMDKIVPPDAANMAEFNKFISDINTFKEEQKEFFEEVAKDIKTSITDEITTQHNEIKSMLTVAINNDAILNAIEDLKRCFRAKIKKLGDTQQENFDKIRDAFETNNQYEQAFEPNGSNLNSEVISEIKSDFEKFETLVGDLSGDNEEIQSVLESIKTKFETINLVKAKDLNPSKTELLESKEIEEDENIDEISENLEEEVSDSETDNEIYEKASDDNFDDEESEDNIIEDDDDDDEYYDEEDDDEKIIVGVNNFDFIKAFDLLKQDIRNLRIEVEKFIPRENNTSIPSLGNDNLLINLNNKIDLLSKTLRTDWLEEIKNYISGSEIQSMLEEISGKIDILTLSDNSEWMDEIKQTLENLNTEGTGESGGKEIQSMLKLINEKIDILASSDGYDMMEDLEYQTQQNDEIKNLLDTLDKKVDIIASTDGLDDIKDSLDEKITSMLESLNHKIDTISTCEGSDTTKKGFEDVKHLIFAQMNYIERLEHNNKTEAVKKCLKELTNEVNNLSENVSGKDVQKTLKDMKESIMAAVITIFDQISFVEESEDIKDFVEEKTDVINQNLVTVTKQLRQITNSAEDPDYTYSMQDIESDLAKLRLALSELQNNELENQTSELSNISDNINRISMSVEGLQTSMTQDEIRELKDEFFVLREQTNKILESSDKSYKTINTGLEDFGKILTAKITKKVDKVTDLLEKSNDSDKVMRQALIYMGEWIDSASESMDKISTNSDEIVDIKTSIEHLKSSIPEQTEILNSIEEKFDEQQERLSFFEKQVNKLSGIEERFDEQQERIDRLEMSIEKILTAVEDIDDTKITRKIDKIDKQMIKLSANIEKLASYVD